MSLKPEEIRSPEDIKNHSVSQLYGLARKIRHFIIHKVSLNGGHLASNLGVVELTIALHYVFDSPRDKIVWDVGHQCYTHKILTGRSNGFYLLRKKGGISGFPRRTESPHDAVDTGHSSTSISAALGILTGQEMGGVSGKVVAVIGDGAFSGGLALEGLNNCGAQKKGLIIILNENQMSISRNVGAMSAYLSRVTATSIYQRIRSGIDRTILSIPWAGKTVMKAVERLKKAVKALFFKKTMFSDLGYEYVGPIDGHNLPVMIHVLKNVKSLNRPVVVHIRTQKGRGYSFSEERPDQYHGVGPFNIFEGNSDAPSSGVTYTRAFSGKLLEKAETDERILAITAAMASGTGLSAFSKKYSDRFFDVGIAEQHALTFAAGLAISGKRPVVAIYSTFMQRAVDQFIHDIAIPRLPVMVMMDRAGLVGGDGETHQGIFDIPLFKSIPGILFMAPSTQDEMERMIDYALARGIPALIRYPKDLCIESRPTLSLPLEAGRGVLARHHKESSVLLISFGSLLAEALEASEELYKKGIEVDTASLRFIAPLDKAFWADLMSRYQRVVIIEDGVVVGGIGESFLALAVEYGIDSELEVFGVPSVFPEHATRDELVRSFGLDSASIVRRITGMENVKQNKG